MALIEALQKAGDGNFLRSLAETAPQILRKADVEGRVDAGLEHTPRTLGGEPCLCLAATDAPLRFRAILPRLLQPIFRI